MKCCIGAWGSAFVGVKDGPRNSRVHSSVVNLRNKSGNLKICKRKNKLPKCQLSKSIKIFKTREPKLGEVAQLFAHLMPGSIYCIPEIEERDICL